MDEKCQSRTILKPRKKPIPHHDGCNSEAINNSVSSTKKRSRDDSPSKDNNAIRFKKLRKDLIIPVPLKNSLSYCFFNSVIQMLRGCIEFTFEIMKYHYSDEVVESPAPDKDKVFVNHFCKLITDMSDEKCGKEKLEKTLLEVHKRFAESKDGDDVNKCFMIVLTIINNVTKSIVNESIDVKDEGLATFSRQRNKNHGFIFDLFYGQFSYSNTCRVCKTVTNRNYQLFKSLPLPVPASTDDCTLLDCIRWFLKPSDIEMEERTKCECPDGSIDFYSQCEITVAPKYLFIYLTRGSYYENGTKNNSFVKSDRKLCLPTKSGEVDYELISTLEHIGDNEGGHYYCKCNCEGSRWWLINDEQVECLGSNVQNIVSRQVNALMFKRIL